MCLLIDIYHHHQLPKGNPALAERHARLNSKAEAELERMKKHSAPSRASQPLDDVHSIVTNKQLPWVKLVEILHTRYKANRFAHWPMEVLLLLAQLFPANEPRQKLNGKESYNLFKSITAMMLHLAEAQPA